jgi:hypothetical protein
MPWLIARPVTATHRSVFRRPDGRVLFSVLDAQPSQSVAGLCFPIFRGTANPERIHAPIVRAVERADRYGVALAFDPD